MGHRLVAAGVMAAVVAAGAVAATRGGTEGPGSRPVEGHTLMLRTEVPRIGDRTTVAEARLKLEAVHLVVELTSVMCPTHGTGSEFVLAADPRPGTVVPTGSTVVLQRCLFQ